MPKNDDTARPDEGARSVNDSPSAEQVKGDVQQQVDRETERGYVGVKVDPTPNEAYTLTTGPDSPTYVPDDNTRVVYPSAKDVADKEAGNA